MVTEPILSSYVSPFQTSLFAMAKRTQIKDAHQVQTVEDLDRLVKDKRTGKRANKRKAKQRQRHYVKTMLRNRRSYLEEEE
ncbi:MAG: hypothetical protein AAFZ63_25510 [Bacteroidota bacterium]